jgi:hypothetical protein
MTASVIEELKLHHLSCSQCRMGEPCVVTEHIHDGWPQRVASKAAANLRKITAEDEKQHVASA